MTKIYSMKNKHPERQPQKAISSGCSFQRYFSSSLPLVIHKRLVLTPASLHYIKVMWGDNVPYHIEIFNSARTYHEQLEEYNRERTASPAQVVNNNYTFNIADTSALHEIISKIRKEAQKVEDNAALLKAIDELEQSIGKPSFFQKYQSFISSAANHVTFFGGIASAIKTISNLLSM